MKKVAVIVMDGFEEGETIALVDILRKANIQCDMFSTQKEVVGGHGIVLESDFLIGDVILSYDMIVLPGGYDGVKGMIENSELISIIQRMNSANKFICAICAAPLVLDYAGVLEDKKYTAYQGYEHKIHHGIFKDDIVVVDDRLITSRGPATVYAFAKALVKELGGDVRFIDEDMYYHCVF